MSVENDSKTRSAIVGSIHDAKKDLARQSIRGSSSLVISEIGCNSFRLVGTIILARILTPEHFGLVAMVTALTSVAEMFKDLGLGTATVQQKVITHAQVSTLFWLNTAVGIALMLLFAVAAPFIAWFYQDPRLLWVTMAIAPTFLLGGLTVQHEALLRREMHFMSLAVIYVLSVGTSTALGIVLAWQGSEYWALVWKELCRSAVVTVGMWLSSHWLPGLPARGVGVRSMFQTGSHVTGFNLFAFASRSLDSILLGKFWGPGALGLYKQAGLLLQLPQSLFSHPISFVMTPALSALQGEPERYCRYYRRALSFLAFGYMPLIAYLAVFAESVISLVLGEKWMGASLVLQILALAVILHPLLGTTGTVMITSGKTREYLHMGAAQAAFFSLLVCIGINWGLIGTAISCVVYSIVSLPVMVSFSLKNTPVAPSIFYEALRLPAIATFLLTGGLVGFRNSIGVHTPVVEIGYSLVLAPVLYFSVWLMFPGGKEQLLEYYSHFRLAVHDLRIRMGFANAIHAS